MNRSRKRRGRGAGGGGGGGEAYPEVVDSFEQIPYKLLGLLLFFALFAAIRFLRALRKKKTS